MKKFIMVIAAVLCLSSAAFAQSRALGVRATYGAELSYQHSIGSNFVEADLGWFKNGFYLTGVYDFVFASEGNFNFYAGPGAAVGFYNDSETSGINLGIAGQLGLEYNFNIPLQLSLDWRPVFNFIHGGFGWEGIALGIRYRF
ncbi:MAG: hypothetical protein ACI3ZH_06430 [Candidatus Cryptobacteroides sp.]|mgnify:FL=1|nr:hypothetical protein [Bacteroidales bacterium]MDD6053099.1 hypothetical protein [Bacteroidales bacterium]